MPCGSGWCGGRIVEGATSLRCAVTARLFVVFCAVAGILGCGSPRPNILLVTFDTTRWDHVGYAFRRRGLTPMLDAMAARGTWFSSCISAQPSTLPSHATIMTGLFPQHHGVRNNGTYVVPEEVTTLAERLHAAGYQTHAVVSAYVLDSQFGLDQGFEEYDDDLSRGPQQKMFMFKEIPASLTTVKAAEWLRKGWSRDRPFFLWIHYFDPHADYEPPSDIAALFPGDPYSGEIHYADRELGRVFKELDIEGILDDTLFVFTSDHGDSLGEHGERTHGLFIYDSTTRVPLLLAGPGVPAGKRVDSLVRTADIVPTVLDLLRLPGRDELDGRSLETAWEGHDIPRIAYVETIMPRQNFGWSELRALRSDRLKAIRAPRPELYDLSKDPGETLNRLLVEGRGADTEGLFARLDAMVEQDPLTHGGHGQADLDAETRKRLEALGYVWQTEGTTGDEPRPDPKDRLRYWEMFQAGQQLMREKQFPQAVTLISNLLEQDPDNIIAMSSLARALHEIGETDKALQVYRDIIASDPKRDTAYIGAAKMLQEKGAYDEAERLLRRVIEMKPEDPGGYTALGDLFLDREAFDDAEAWFRQALEVDAHSSLAAGGLGNCLNRAGKVQEAARVLRAALERDPSSHTVTYNLAVVTERLGDKKGALALYERAIRLDPEHSMSWNNLGSLLNGMGKREEGLKMIRRAHELDPANVEATFNLGAILLVEGRPEEALPLLEAAARQRPGFARAHILTAKALEALGRTDDAIFAWRTLGDTAPVAWLNIARIELERGRKPEAVEALKQGVAMDGDRFRRAVGTHKGLEDLMKHL